MAISWFREGLEKRQGEIQSGVAVSAGKFLSECGSLEAPELPPTHQSGPGRLAARNTLMLNCCYYSVALPKSEGALHMHLQAVQTLLQNEIKQLEGALEVNAEPFAEKLDASLYTQASVLMMSTTERLDAMPSELTHIINQDNKTKPTKP